jgi:hypothetical protein
MIGEEDATYMDLGVLTIDTFFVFVTHFLLVLPHELAFGPVHKSCGGLPLMHQLLQREVAVDAFVHIEFTFAYVITRVSN